MRCSRSRGLSTTPTTNGGARAADRAGAIAARSASRRFAGCSGCSHASREPAMVFTEYRDTLDAVVAALSPSRARRDRSTAACRRIAARAAVDAFNDGRIDVLVATDAAGEGLNLHHRCRLVIDVELPWNPLRLEQRIGRVDRLGQQRHRARDSPVPSATRSRARPRYASSRQAPRRVAHSDSRRAGRVFEDAPRLPASTPGRDPSAVCRPRRRGPPAAVTAAAARSRCRRRRERVGCRRCRVTAAVRRAASRHAVIETRADRRWR